MALPGVPTMPQTVIRLSIECKGLANKDTFSKSDPMCVVSMKAKDGRWNEIGRTEQIQNDLNPKFKTSIKVDYSFEENQEIQFLLYDIDNNSGRLDQQDFLGSLQTTVASIVGSRGSCLARPLHGKAGPDQKKYGVIKILAEEVSGGKGDSIRVRLASTNLATKDWFGKGDKYLMFKRVRGDGQLETVHKTEVVKNSKEPSWMPIEIPLQQFNLGNMSTPIIIEVWDWNAMGKHDYIGQVATTTTDLLKVPNRFKVEKPNSKTHKDRGELIVQHAEIFHPPSFLDYISGGCEIQVMVAIDFTASNGNPSDPKSLHYKNPNGWNNYQQAIMSVGEILEKYDHDKLFEAYGFGGKLPNGQVSHCFALNGQTQGDRAGKVHGVQGILDAYQECLQNVELYGPTNFASIIKKAHEATKRIARPGAGYFVLLILTDGEITDMENTIDAIVDAAGEALSIVIVGVGPADFSKMKRLDGDDQALTSGTGRRVQRDIVQFVSFRDLRNNGALLAKEVLYEIPDQLVSYMTSKNARPGARPQMPSNWFSEASFGDSFARLDLQPGGGQAQSRPLQNQPAAPGMHVPAPAPQAAPLQPQSSYRPPPPDDVPPPPYSDLPPGWEEKLDPGSQRPYYVNHITKSTQWDRPAAAPPPPPPYVP